MVDTFTEIDIALLLYGSGCEYAESLHFELRATIDTCLNLFL